MSSSTEIDPIKSIFLTSDSNDVIKPESYLTKSFLNAAKKNQKFVKVSISCHSISKSFKCNWNLADHRLPICQCDRCDYIAAICGIFNLKIGDYNIECFACSTRFDRETSESV